MRELIVAALLTCACSGVCQSQQSTPKTGVGYPVRYSNMHIVEEEGDVVGWDLRVKRLSDRYEITLFCGEGEVQGPVHATFQLRDGMGAIHPIDTICGEYLELKFEARGIRIKAPGRDFEFVPQHKNFTKEEHWR